MKIIGLMHMCSSVVLLACRNAATLGLDRFLNRNVYAQASSVPLHSYSRLSTTASIILLWSLLDGQGDAERPGLTASWKETKWG